MKSQLKLSILVVCTLLVMLGLAVLHNVFKSSGSSKPAIDPGTSTMAIAPSPTDTAPSANNVSSQYQAEIDALTNRLKEVPNDTTHLLRLAVLYQDGHQAKKAIPLYERYLKRHPGNHQAWLDLTSCYGNVSDWNNALNTSKRMLSRFPDDSFGLYNLGAIYANMGRTKEARSEWSRIITLNTNANVVAMATKSLNQLNQQDIPNPEN